MCACVHLCLCACVCLMGEQQQDDDDVTRSNLIMLFMMELVPGWLRIVFVGVRAYINKAV